MGMKPSVSPCGSGMIQKQLGTAYDVVKEVRDNLDVIRDAAAILDEKLDHTKLANRNSPNQHSISSISGLEAELATKQQVLQSGVNIKTIGGQHLLGEGDVELTPENITGLSDLLDAEVVKQVGSIEELRTKAGTSNGQQISLSGYYAGSLKGGGILVWDADSTAADDGGVTFAVAGVTTGRWVRLLDGFVTPETFGARGDGVNIDTNPLQSSLNKSKEIRVKLLLSDSTYLIDDTIIGSGKAFIQGAGFFFRNDYVNGALDISGSIIKVAPGTNKNAIEWYADLDGLVGTSYPRTHVVMKDFCVFGNKSAALSPTATDLNSSGDGIAFKGISYATLNNMLAYRCAGNGFSAESFDYGDGQGLRGCNNFIWSGVTSINNAGNGFSLFIGDSQMHQLVGGYNGLDGYNGSCNMTDSLFWDNKRRGVAALSSNCSLANIKTYDNDEAGVWLGSETCSLSNVDSYSNGAGGSTSTAVSVGILVSSSVQSVNMSGGFIGNRRNVTQRHGITVSSASTLVVLNSPVMAANIVSNISGSALSNVHYHSDNGTAIRHPGFTLTGRIDANANRITALRAVSFNSWSSATLSSGNISAGNDTLLSVNPSSAETVNTISASDLGLSLVIIRNISTTNTLTFTHNDDFLRLNGRANKTLGRNESIKFVRVTADIWQEI